MKKSLLKKDGRNTGKALVLFVFWMLIPVRFIDAACQGPYYHQVYGASSTDGLAFTHDNRLLVDHASVPAAIVAPDGRILIYYVDAGKNNGNETVNCAESTDGGLTFTVLGCTIKNGAPKALDPSIVLLPDGRYRLYYFGMKSGVPITATEKHDIHSAISTDGVNFVEEQVVFTYMGLVDPDVFWTGKEWLMFVYASQDRATIIAKSTDGLNFTYAGPLALDGWGTVAPFKLEDGRFRLFAFDQKTNATVASFLSTDGYTWTREEGVRIKASAGTRLTDPFVVHLPEGGWKMIFKVDYASGQAMYNTATGILTAPNIHYADSLYTARLSFHKACPGIGDCFTLDSLVQESQASLQGASLVSSSGESTSGSFTEAEARDSSDSCKSTYTATSGILSLPNLTAAGKTYWAQLKLSTSCGPSTCFTVKSVKPAK